MLWCNNKLRTVLRHVKPTRKFVSMCSLPLIEIWGEKLFPVRRSARLSSRQALCRQTSRGKNSLLWNPLQVGKKLWERFSSLAVAIYSKNMFIIRRFCSPKDFSWHILADFWKFKCQEIQVEISSFETLVDHRAHCFHWATFFLRHDIPGDRCIGYFVW